MPPNNKDKRRLRRSETLLKLQEAHDIIKGLHDIRLYTIFDTELIQAMKQELLKIYQELCNLYEEVR